MPESGRDFPSCLQIERRGHGRTARNRWRYVRYDLVVTTHKVPRVLGLANWSTIDGGNYARADAPSSIRAWDLAILLAAFVAMAILWGGAGMALFVPAAFAYLLVAGFSRAVMGTLLARRVDRVIDAEALRTSDQARTKQ